MAGDSWLAVDDAASIFDPLSSYGIVKAHCSGVCASYAIADPLTCGIYLGLAGYHRYMHQEFVSHSRVEAKYHSEENHWP